jgi:hypothetical protein
MGDQNPSVEYSEIDLADYVKSLFKQKRLILAVFLVAIIATVVATLMMPKIYKVEASLEVGRIGGELIESPDSVIGKISDDIYGISVRQKLGISEKDYPEIKTENIKGTNLVATSIESEEIQRAKDILGDINSLILEDHQKKIQEKRNIIERNIGRLRNKVASFEEEKKNIEAKIVSLQKIAIYQQSVGNQFALFDSKENLEKKKQDIENMYLEINSSEMILGGIQSTIVAKVPTISENPIKPNLVLNIIIAGVLGLFIGVFLAFCKEWWEKNRANITAKNI